MKLQMTTVSCSRVAQSKHEHTCETAEHSRQLLSWLLQEER